MNPSWSLKKISDICDFQNSKRIPLKSLDREKRQGEYPYYGASGIVDYIDDYVFDGKYLLISEDGENLRTRNTPIAFQAEGKFWVNNHAHVLSEKEQGVLDYLEYYFSILNINPYITGAVQPKLNKANLDVIEIPIPSLDERLKINQILNSLKEKIKLNNQINQTLESIAQAIFKSWFIDFEPVRAKITAKQTGQDPEFAAMCVISGKSEAELEQMAAEDFAELQATAALFPDELVESELGEVPMGWEVKRFEDLLDTLESGTRPKGGVSGISEGMPSVGAENILGLGIYNYGKEKFVPYSFFEKMRKGKVQDYDVLLYKDGGKPGEFKPRVSLFGKGFPYAEFSINEHVFRIRSTTLGQFFLYFKIKSPEILSQLASKGAKAAIPGINQNDVKSIYISCPTDSILDKFNSLVESLVNSILKNSIENNCLKSLIDTLLPKLLSGEVEVGNL